MKKLFFDDLVLQQLEKDGKWEETIDYIIKNKNIKDKSVFLRLAAQSWYILTFFDCCLPKEKIDRNKCLNLLKILYEMVMTVWNKDQDCLWLFGYFMCVNQSNFDFLDESIFEIEKRGNAMILEAYNISQDNPLVNILYFSEAGSKMRYYYTKKKNKKFLKDFFPSESSVDKYFIEIFI